VLPEGLPQITRAEAYELEETTNVHGAFATRVRTGLQGTGSRVIQVRMTSRTALTIRSGSERVLRCNGKQGTDQEAQGHVSERASELVLRRLVVDHVGILLQTVTGLCSGLRFAEVPRMDQFIEPPMMW